MADHARQNTQPPPNTLPRRADDLFRHISAEKAPLYRAIMDVFATAKRQYRLQLRPDEVLAAGDWGGTPPTLEDLTTALGQLASWGNLDAQPDTARVQTLEDFYRARFLYQLSQGGEAVEAAVETFARTLHRRAELQTIALEDIAGQLQALQTLLEAEPMDVAKVHQNLRDLTRVFEGLAENAQAFMAGMARGVDLRQADATAIAAQKHRLIEYLERFMGDLVRRSGSIGSQILALEPHMAAALNAVAGREAVDAAPGDDREAADEHVRRLDLWHERWSGLKGWFVASPHERSQAELLRARGRSAIPQLLGAIGTINERRSGRSDRSADFRVLAGWFLDCPDDASAHRLGRVAFALAPARHLSLNTAAEGDVPASTPWADAPKVTIHPRLREYGEATPRGPLPSVRDRDAARARLVRRLAEEDRQLHDARRLLATGRPVRLSELDHLDRHAFGLFLSLLGEALADQETPDTPVERDSGDGLLTLRLEPLGPETQAAITTPDGVFRGRDHVLTITPMGEA